MRTRVTSYSSIDRVTQRDYGFFCPTCFVEEARRLGYDKGTKGMLFDTKRTKAMDFTLIFPFWMTFIFGFILNFVYFGIGFVFWLATIILYFMIKKKVEGNFNKYHRALDLSQEEQPTVAPVTKTIITGQEAIITDSKPITQDISSGIDPNIVYCSKCGHPNQTGSQFCNKCGGKVLTEG